MISYEGFCRVRHLHDVEGLSARQIARQLGVSRRTVRKYLSCSSYPARARDRRRESKLDVFKGRIIAWLEGPGLSATQIFDRIKEQGYEGGYSILKEFIRQVRPKRQSAFLTLQFDPGEAAQIDWGAAGTLTVGSTRRRLSFLSVVLCHSRLMYVEFFLGEGLEMFLAGQQRAFEFFGGVPSRVILDNLKTGVLSHGRYDAPVFHPHYMDFAAHYGFNPVACNVRAPHEKGRVENSVGYIKGSFLRGLPLSSLAVINEAAFHWRDHIANVRTHGVTKQVPRVVFDSLEKPALGPLPPVAYDAGLLKTARVNRQCRVTLDTNRYSVPAPYAAMAVTLKIHPERLCMYYKDKLVATHVRSFDRHQDYEQPEHLESLKAQRPRGRRQRLLADFLNLGSHASVFHEHLQERTPNPEVHLRKILALAQVHGQDPLIRALEDACEHQAFSSDYILHIVTARLRAQDPPGPLHLTRTSDLLDLDIPAADLSLYETNTPPHTHL